MFAGVVGQSVWNAATGGTVSTITVAGKKYRLHAFTSGTETFSISRGLVPFSVLAVGGGGGGSPGGGDIRSGWGGGGSGGQCVEQSVSLSNTQYSVTVGSGGSHISAGPGTSGQNGTGGSASSFGNVITASGGRGGLRNLNGDGATLTSSITGTSVTYGSNGCSNCCHTGQGRHSEGVDGLGSGGGGQEQGQNTDQTFGCRGGKGVVYVRYEVLG